MKYTQKEAIAAALDLLDAAYIEEYWEVRKGIGAPKRSSAGKKRALVLHIAAAVSIAVMGIVWLLPALRGYEPPPPVEGTVTEGKTGSNTLPETATPDTIPGDVIVLTPEMLTSGILTGTPAHVLGGLPTGQGGGEVADQIPIHFPVDQEVYILTARAIEVLPDAYVPLSLYSSGYKSPYRMIKMTVIDPLYSGMSGEFYYLMPEYLMQDFTRYDALLIAVSPPRGNMYYNISTGELVSFSQVFQSGTGSADEWNMIPFTDAVFDPSIWEHSAWRSSYDSISFALDSTDDSFADYQQESWSRCLLVHFGCTYEEAIQNLRTIRESGPDSLNPPKLFPDFTSPEALEAMAYVKPFKHGVFNTYGNMHGQISTRYINGCITNEQVLINRLNGVETVHHVNCFEASDMENLPDVAGYVESLNIASIRPPHINPDDVGQLVYCSVQGCYYKTEAGVHAFVAISWIYDFKDGGSICPDDAYIHITHDGTTLLTRDEMRELIGNSDLFPTYEPGVWEPIPMP